MLSIQSALEFWERQEQLKQQHNLIKESPPLNSEADPMPKFPFIAAKLYTVDVKAY